MTTNMADKLKRQISAKSITAYFIFGAIVMVFVFFGLPGEMGAGIGQVARVNNAFVSVADYQQEEQRMQQYFASMFGGSVDFSDQKTLLQQRAVENLVRMELVSQAAQKMGVLATDAEVRDFIVKDIPVFQQNGLFQKDLYMRYIESTRATPADFEAKIRKDIQNTRSRRLFEMASSPMKLESLRNEELREMKANYSIARIEEDRLLKSIDGKPKMTREQLDQELKVIDEALAKNDMAAVEKALANLDTKWEDTGLIELAAENWPKVTSPSVKKAALELTKSAPVSNVLLREGSLKYIVKLKEAKLEKPTAVSVEDSMFQRRRGDGLFEAWVNQFRKASNVEINSAIFTK